MTVAASFGLAAALSVVVLGDASGYSVSLNQKMKMAAIEAMWHTEPAPAAFTVVGIPDAQARTTHAAIKLPWVLGLIGTHSIDQTIPGIAELVEDAKARIGQGLKAYDAMLALRRNPDDAQAKAVLAANGQDLGYALLLKQYADDPRQATPAQIQQAADSTIPNVPVLFWAFRIMVGCAFYFIALFALSFWKASKRRLDTQRGYLRLHRTWQAGDRVELTLPMAVRRVYADARIEAARGRVALMRGPLLYCVEGADQADHVSQLVLPRESPLRAVARFDLLGGVTVITGQAQARVTDKDDQTPATRKLPFLAVPFYAWDNRTPGEMAVWLPEAAQRD